MYTCSTQIMRNAALHPASRHLQIKRVLKLLLKTLSTQWLSRPGITRTYVCSFSMFSVTHTLISINWDSIKLKYESLQQIKDF